MKSISVLQLKNKIAEEYKQEQIRQLVKVLETLELNKVNNCIDNKEMAINLFDRGIRIKSWEE